jgi:hypothetical protein
MLAKGLVLKYFAICGVMAKKTLCRVENLSAVTVA